MLRAGRVAPASSFHSCTSRPRPLKKTTVSILLNMARYVSEGRISCTPLTSHCRQQTSSDHTKESLAPLTPSPAVGSPSLVVTKAAKECPAGTTP